MSTTICLINMSEHLLLSLFQQVNAAFPQPWGIIKRRKKSCYKNTQKLIHWGRSSQHATCQGLFHGPPCLPEHWLSSSLLWQGNGGKLWRTRRLNIGIHMNFRKEQDKAYNDDLKLQICNPLYGMHMFKWPFVTVAEKET